MGDGVAPPPDRDVVQAVAGIESRIYLLRGSRIMLSTDLAQLYEVETRALMQAVRRNASRFPDDFMFELTRDEAENLRSRSVILDDRAVASSGSQNVILKRSGRGDERRAKYGMPTLADYLDSAKTILCTNRNGH